MRYRSAIDEGGLPVTAKVGQLSTSRPLTGLVNLATLGMEDREYWRNEKVAFLAMTTLKGVGFWTLHKAAQSGAGFKTGLRSPEGTHIDKILRDNSLTPAQAWERGIELARELTAAGIMLFFKNEKGFPQKLKNIPDAPEWIFIQGKMEPLSSYAVTLVGTRKPSDDGLFLTKYVVATLAPLTCVTVSGLATGIDQTAHLESIRYNIPTVAVLGTGILQNYPKGSEDIRSKIISAGGTVISEYLPNQSYSAENFVRRNRLQAALGNVLIPAEWAIKSGTAHTVKYAYNYQKKIINLYLPHTLLLRPEIEQSKQDYGALSFEVPQLHEAFQEILLSESISQPVNHSEHEVDYDAESEIINEDDNAQLSLF